jgi:quercetin dioxygenase-like cupin family protein
MKRILMLLLGMATIGLQAQAGDAKVTYIGHDTVAKGGTLLSARNVIVQVNTRKEAGVPEYHDKETDTFYILDGSATFITGGEMVDSKVTEPGQRRGTGIRGGETHHLAKGDVMIIPSGMPHWFKEVPSSVTYYVVKVVAP